MSALCLSTDMSSSDAAAWVQAFGSIVAILAAAGIAVWQSRRQHQSAMKLHKAEARHQRTEATRTLGVLTQCVADLVAHYRRQLAGREAVHDIASEVKYFDFGSLPAIEAMVNAIPIWSLPASIVKHAMGLQSTVRQFREKVEEMFRSYRQLDAAQYERVFTYLDEMEGSLKLTAADIRREIVASDN